MTKSLRSSLIFWGLFIFLNAVLYFQNYLSFWGSEGFASGPTVDAGSWTGRIHMLFSKNEYDYLKLSGELLVFISFFFFIRQPNKWLNRILYTAFIFLFVYNIYYEFNQKFYGITPAFQNDYVLLSEVLPIFINSLSGNATLSYIGAVVFIILTGVFFVYTLRLLLNHFEQIKSGRLTQILFICLWVFTIIYSTYSSSRSLPPRLLSTHWMSPSISKSLFLDGADKYRKKIDPEPFEGFMKQKLTKKPNVYLLFVESYGTVATEAPELKNNYSNYINQIEDELKKADYHMASRYSVSPVKGGRSWLAFSSFMSGLWVENQIQYNDLIQKNFDYPNMVKFFNQQGYQSYRLSTMSNINADSLIPYTRTNLYWGFDEWWTYKDFHYEGPKFDVLGGIPDQYALGYFRDVISKKKNKAPSLLFFISMNSHVPWYKPPPFLDDWKAFNSMDLNYTPTLEGDDIFRFEKSIHYELELMTQFILEEEEPSIFMLIGDHQPPGLEYKIWDYTDDAATPIHIISKDSILVNNFLENEFQKGLEIDLSQQEEYLRHDEFYELFLRILLK